MLSNARRIQRGLPRHEKREVRRHQLIEGAITVIAEKGLRETSLDLIAKAAGVSHGMVNFHFSSKEKLMLVIISTLAEGQIEKLRAAADGQSDPGLKLRAILETEFSKSNFSRKEGAVWQDFWNEARSNEKVFKVCRKYTRDNSLLLRQVIEALVEKHGLEDFPVDVAIQSIQSMTDGLWEDYVTLNTIDRKKAIGTCIQVLRWMFPMEEAFH